MVLSMESNLSYIKYSHHYSTVKAAAKYCFQLDKVIGWGHTWTFFNHSIKYKFTMVNGFFNVTSFSHFTMVNASLVCCISKSSRMKPKFMIAKRSEKAWFIKGLSKLCLLRWHLVMNFENHFMTLLNLHTPTIYMCFLPPSRTRIFWLSVSSSGFSRLWKDLYCVTQLFTQFMVSNFHFHLLKYNYNSLKNKHESVHSEVHDH